ncbi:hypothetical protein ABIB17_001694 [Arthrobacter sp. UYEF6]
MIAGSSSLRKCKIQSPLPGEDGEVLDSGLPADPRE